MAKQIFVDDAATILALPVLAADLTITVADGSAFPTPSGGDWFEVTLFLGDFSLDEIIHCTGRAGNVLTVLRGQNGTVARDWAANTNAHATLTAGGVSQIMVQARDLTTSLLTTNVVPRKAADGTLVDSGLSDDGTTITTGRLIRATNATASTSTSTGALVISGGLGVAGAAFIGGQLNATGTTHTFGSAVTSNHQINLNANAATLRYYGVQTVGVQRWNWGAEATAESGADAGSSWILRAYTDAGTGIDNPIAVVRAAGGTITTTRPFRVTNATASTSTTTGSAVFSGGLGVAGALYVGGAVNTQELWLNGAAGTSRTIKFNTVASLRWAISAEGTAESGSNAGSNFQINSYTDAGAYQDTPLEITRASGGSFVVRRNMNVTAQYLSLTNANVILGVGGNAGNSPSILLNSAVGKARNLIYQTAGVARWSIVVDGSAESGSNVGSGFVINSFSDAGVLIDSPISVTRAAGGTLTIARQTNITVSAANNNLNILGDAGYNRAVIFRTGSSSRWFLGADGAAESGSNAGSVFSIGAYTDAGAFIDSPISITRAAGGTMTITRPIVASAVAHRFGNGTGAIDFGFNTSAGANRDVIWYTNSSARWGLRTGSSAESGSNAGSNFSLVSYTDAGAQIDAPLVIIRAAGGTLTTTRPFRVTDTAASTSTTTGSTVVSGGLGVAGAIYAGSTITTAASMVANGDTHIFGAAIGATNLTVTMRAAAGTNRDLIWKTADSPRWMFRTTSSAEGSTSDGSNFSILAFTNAGGYIDNVLDIIRAAGGNFSTPRPFRSTNTTDSTSLTTGGAVFSGGAVVTKSLFVGNHLVMPKTSGYGIKVDTTTPTFPWHDLTGTIRPDPTGANAPTLSPVVVGGLVRDYFYTVGDKMDMEFHIPHDYLPGSDIFIHIHWLHNGTAISGSLTVNLAHQYAKGHNQAAFGTEKTVAVSYNTVNIATTPRYQHRIDEVQLSVNGGSATQLDSAAIEVDGMILVNMTVAGIPTITGGSPNEPCIAFVDLHYQSTGIGTKQKAPNFWT